MQVRKLTILGTLVLFVSLGTSCGEETDDGGGEASSDATADTTTPTDASEDTSTSPDTGSRDTAPSDVPTADGGGDTDATGGSDTSKDTRVADTDDAGGLPCNGGVHGTAAQIASTPRAKQNLELLALTVTSEVVAPQPVYSRVTRDVPKIRKNYSEVSNINYRPYHDGKTLRIEAADRKTRKAIRNGTFQGWSCLNNHYVDKSVSHVTGNYFNLELEGLYKIDVVAGDYRAVQGIADATNGTTQIGGGSTICAEKRGDDYHYVFDDAWGDCPSGCINHHYHYFTVDGAGNITKKDDWRNNSGNPPKWVSICKRP